MNLKQLRLKFRDLSGRYDLVNDDDTDNGADFFLYEGQRLLDRLGENQKSWASSFKFVIAGNYIVSIPFCRSIKEVWAISSVARWQLTKMDMQDLISEYLSGDPADRIPGTPEYYSPIITRFIPEDTTALTIESFLDFVEISFGDQSSYNSIVLNVPTDIQLSIEIKGLFYSRQLENNTDTNYWSTVHPGLLIKAALRELEVFNQNRDKVKIWDESIALDIDGINKDLVEELIAEIDVMEG